MGACTERGASMAPAAIRSMVLTDFPAFDRFDGALHAMHQQARPDLFAPCKHLFKIGRASCRERVYVLV